MDIDKLGHRCRLWRSLLATCASIAAASALAMPAQARTRSLTPPGNSSVTQYVEPLPTVQGNRPSTAVGGGATNLPGGGLSVSSAVSPATTQAMLAQGASGRAAADFARASAPAKGHSGVTGAVGQVLPSGGVKPALPAASGLSPTAAILKALTGSSSGGGLGVLLPIVLIAAFVGAGLLAVARRRSH